MKLTSVFLLVVAISVYPHKVIALSDTQYEMLKQNSHAFVEADRKLGKIWKQVTSGLGSPDTKEQHD